MNHATMWMNRTARGSRTLRRLGDQPSKARKHRYERRKMRGVIRLTDGDEDRFG